MLVVWSVWCVLLSRSHKKFHPDGLIKNMQPGFYKKNGFICRTGSQRGSFFDKKDYFSILNRYSFLLPYARRGEPKAPQ